MSAPVRPPLSVTDGTTTVRPTNGITFDSADGFTVTKNGTNARIDFTGGGGGTIGGSIAATQVAFGSAADSIEGEDAFTYDKTINQLKLTGFGDALGEFIIERSSAGTQTISMRNDSSTSPIIRVNSAGTNAKYMQFMNTISTSSTSGGSSGFIFYHQTDGNSGTLYEFLRMKTDDSSTYEVVFNEDSKNQDFRIESDAYVNMFALDGGLNKIFMGNGSVDNSLGLVQISVGNSTQNALTLISTDADATSAPTMEFYRNSASPAAGDQLGIIVFSGNNTNGDKETYGSINVQIDIGAVSDSTSMQFKVKRSGTEVDNFRIRYSEVVVNEDSTDCDFRVETNGNVYGFHVDAANDTVGIGGIGASDVALHVFDDNNQDVLVRLETDENSADKSPALEFYKNSAADISDYIMAIDSFGLDDASNKSQYSRIATYIEDETAGTENAVIIFQVAEAGSMRNNIVMGSTLVTVNGSSRNVDFRVLADDGSKNIYSDAGINAVGIQEQPTTGLADNNPALQVEGSISGKMPIIIQNSDVTLTRAGLSGQTYVITDGGTTALTMPLGAKQGDYFYFVASSGSTQIVVDVGTQILNGGTGALTRTTNNEVYTVICIEDDKFILSNPA